MVSLGDQEGVASCMEGQVEVAFLLLEAQEGEASCLEDLEEASFLEVEVVEVEDLQLPYLVVEEEGEEEASHQRPYQEEEEVEGVGRKLTDYCTYFVPFNHTTALDLAFFLILQHFSEERQAHVACLPAVKPSHLYRVLPNLIRRPCSRIQVLHRDAWRTLQCQ